MINQAVHAIAMALSWMGPVESVMAQVCNLTHPDITGEDRADILVRYKSGAVGNFLLTNNQREGFYAGATVTDVNRYNIEIQTDESMFVAGPDQVPPPPFVPRVNRWYVPIKGLDDSVPVEKSEADKKRAAMLETINREDENAFNGMDNPQMDFHVPALANFFRAANGDEEICVSPQMGREAVALITAAYISSESGTRVSMPLAANPSSETFEGRRSIYRLA
jgi:predicted dehydrogenase